MSPLTSFTLSLHMCYLFYLIVLHLSSSSVFIPVPGELLLRLTGGSYAGEGKVEVNVMNEWRSVCNDKWDARDAAVVCRQLGYA